MQHEGHGREGKGCLLGAAPEPWAEAPTEAAVYPCAFFLILCEKNSNWCIFYLPVVAVALCDPQTWPEGLCRDPSSSCAAGPAARPASRGMVWPNNWQSHNPKPPWRSSPSPAPRQNTQQLAHGLIPATKAEEKGCWAESWQQIPGEGGDFHPCCCSRAPAAPGNHLPLPVSGPFCPAARHSVCPH